MNLIQKTWKVIPLVDSQAKARFLLISKATFQISVAAGLYESHLVSGGRSHNTCRNRLMGCTYLYSWADQIALNVDALFLSGRGFEVRQIRRFFHWLSHTYIGNKNESLTSGTIGAILHSCLKISEYMYEQYFEVGTNINRAAALGSVLKQNKDDWNSVMPSPEQSSEAPDLTDEEIERIDALLHPDARNDIHPEVAVRDYLMWRLTSKLGMRIGEVLALRICDCPSTPREPLRIVRIGDRGRDYRDPRAPYAPRPKTLTRELDLYEDPVLPQLLARYISLRQHPAQGKTAVPLHSLAPDHEFLIINHLTRRPLSTSGAQQIAERIAELSEVNFHWHISRHAYFNREFDKIADLENYAALRDVLQYKGGWKNPKSLNTYIRRILRQRALGALGTYQSRLGKMGINFEPVSEDSPFEDNK